MNPFETFNPELGLISLETKKRKLEMQIKGLKYAYRNADLLKIEHFPVDALETKEAELLDVRHKLILNYN